MAAAAARPLEGVWAEQGEGGGHGHVQRKHTVTRRKAFWRKSTRHKAGNHNQRRRQEAFFFFGPQK